mgnify:CR=1 FL=1
MDEIQRVEPIVEISLERYASLLRSEVDLALLEKGIEDFNQDREQWYQITMRDHLNNTWKKQLN